MTGCVVVTAGEEVVGINAAVEQAVATKIKVRVIRTKRFFFQFLLDKTIIFDTFSNAFFIAEGEESEPRFLPEMFN